MRFGLGLSVPADVRVAAPAPAPDPPKRKAEFPRDIGGWSRCNGLRSAGGDVSDDERGELWESTDAPEMEARREGREGFRRGIGGGGADEAEALRGESMGATEGSRTLV